MQPPGTMARRLGPPRMRRGSIALAAAVAGGLLACGTAALAQTAPARTRAVPEQTASLPRPQAGAAALPRVLSPADAARMRRIFLHLARGALEMAAAEAEALEDRRLLGHALALAWTRPGAAPPGEAALLAWLSAYGDHPEAAGIAALLPPEARARLAAPGPASSFATPAAYVPPIAEVPQPEPAIPVARNPALERAVRERGRQGDAAAALALIARTPGLGPVAEARLRGEAAFGLFQAARDEDALRLAAAASDAEPRLAGPAFAAGLAAWGLGRWDAALLHFERAARGEGASPAQQAAAAFWAARAAVRARRPAQYVPWMMRAAQEPRSFHGLVARRALGLSPGFAWTREVLGEAEAAALAAIPAGWRALALLQVGQAGLAEAELRQLWGAAQGNPVLARAVMIVADLAGLPGLSALASQAAPAGEDGRPRDYLRYPLPALRPAGGFGVDPALLYAIALQESRFDPAAISSAGARGLLQVMPATASFIANDPELRGEEAWRLHDPELSMELGQRYLLFLARSEITGGDLIRILAAYNAGPGNVQRWQPAQRHRDDPFLFIEAIPLDETRDYVQKVLAYSWIYASRLGLPAPSLDQMAAGKFPEFLTVERLTAMLAPTHPVRPARSRRGGGARVAGR